MCASYDQWEMHPPRKGIVQVSSALFFSATFFRQGVLNYFLAFGIHNYHIKKTRGAASNGGGAKEKFPAMTQTEIEDWLEHVPVFAVTDAQGSGVVLKPDNETSVFFFFMSPMQANATLNQLKSAQPEMDLKISAFSLGKIWFNLLQSGDDKEVTVS